MHHELSSSSSPSFIPFFSSKKIDVAMAAALISLTDNDNTNFQQKTYKNGFQFNSMLRRHGMRVFSVQVFMRINNNIFYANLTFTCKEEKTHNLRI